MDGIQKARELLARARSIVALTGAGISAESGIPTFRGPGGMWRQWRPEDLATPAAFARDPRLVWEWYDWRRGLIARATPNAGHRALVDLENGREKFTLVTQNVDGLHDLAGSRNTVKLHGDIWRMRCTECRAEWTDRRVPLPELPPRCRCGAMARPAIVWFGESLPDGAMEQAEQAACRADVLLVIGTSAVVYPAAGLVPYAVESGAQVIEINTEPSLPGGEVAYALKGPAGEILPRLLG